MKIWPRILIAAAAAAIMVLSAWAFRRVPDPLFNGKPASIWREELTSADHRVRREAQTALLGLGEAAVPQVRKLLRSRSPAWEPYALMLANRFPAFTYETRDHVNDRKRAAEMLGLLGPKASGASKELIDALVDDAVAPEAERALRKIGGAAVPELREALAGHRHAAARRRSARLLREAGPLSPETRAALIMAAGDGAWEVRREAVLGLGEGSEGDAAAREALLGRLKDDAWQVRAAAASALGERGEKSLKVMAALRELAGDRSAEARLESGKALWRLGAESEGVLAILIPILETEAAWGAAYALADMREAAVPAIPPLIDALRKERVPRPFRSPPSAAFALGRIGAPAAQPVAELLMHAQPQVRLGAVMALSAMGRAALPAIPALLPLLEDKENEVRYAAALTLGTLGEHSKNVVDGLTACLSAEDIYMQFAAADLLDQFKTGEKQITLGVGRD